MYLRNKWKLTHFLRSQIRTLSDAATYKLPDAPKESAVTGVSPARERPRFAVPDNVLPLEHSVLTAYEGRKKEKTFVL